MKKKKKGYKRWGLERKLLPSSCLANFEEKKWEECGGVGQGERMRTLYLWQQKFTWKKKKESKVCCSFGSDDLKRKERIWEEGRLDSYVCVFLIRREVG